MWIINLHKTDYFAYSSAPRKFIWIMPILLQTLPGYNEHKNVFYLEKIVLLMNWKYKTTFDITFEYKVICPFLHTQFTSYTNKFSSNFSGDASSSLSYLLYWRWKIYSSVILVKD